MTALAGDHCYKIATHHVGPVPDRAAYFISGGAPARCAALKSREIA